MPVSNRAYLTSLWNSLSQKEKEKTPLVQFIAMKEAEARQYKDDVAGVKGIWDQSFSGKMKPGSEAEELFMSLYGDGKFHGGGIGGVDRQMSGGVMNEYSGFAGNDSPFGNRWLGKDSPLSMANGSNVSFRRDVSPYMMYKHPNDPNKWDEVEWGPREGLGYSLQDSTRMKQQAQQMRKQDMAEDAQRSQLKHKLMMESPEKFMGIQGQQILEEMISAIMSGNYGG